MPREIGDFILERFRNYEKTKTVTLKIENDYKLEKGDGIVFIFPIKSP